MSDTKPKTLLLFAICSLLLAAIHFFGDIGGRANDSELNAADRITQAVSYGFVPWLFAWVVVKVGAFLAKRRNKAYARSQRWRWWTTTFLILLGAASLPYVPRAFGALH